MQIYGGNKDADNIWYASSLNKSPWWKGRAPI